MGWNAKDVDRKGMLERFDYWVDSNLDGTTGKVVRILALFMMVFVPLIILFDKIWNEIDIDPAVILTMGSILLLLESLAIRIERDIQLEERGSIGRKAIGLHIGLGIVGAIVVQWLFDFIGTISWLVAGCTFVLILLLAMEITSQPR
jgi:hypothetical protein